MRLAIDNVAKLVVTVLEAAGHEVVVRRGKDEDLASWMTRVQASTADALVATSREAGMAATRLGIYWVRIRGSWPAESQVGPALANMARILRHEAQAQAVPTGHYLYEELRDGERLTFSVCDNVPNVCPEFHPVTGELINIYLDGDQGLKHMVTCEECQEAARSAPGRSSGPDQALARSR